MTFCPEVSKLAKALWSGVDLEASPAWQRLSVNKKKATMDRICDMRKARVEKEVRKAWAWRGHRSWAGLGGHRS